MTKRKKMIAYSSDEGSLHGGVVWYVWYAVDSAYATARLDDGLTTNLFAYNLRSELTSAHMSTNLYAYTYDPIGNRLSATENGATTLYAANELNQYTALNPAFHQPHPLHLRHRQPPRRRHLPRRRQFLRLRWRRTLDQPRRPW